MKLAQSKLLVVADLHHCGRFLFVMDAKAGEESRQALEAKPCRLRAKSKVPIEGVLKAFVDRPHLLPDPTTPEHGLLRDIVHPFEGFPVVRGQHPPTDFRPILIDENPMAINDIDAGFGQEDLRYISERARQQNVVTIEVGHDLAVETGEDRD